MSVAVDPTQQADLLLHELHTDRHGLSQREADRRLVRYGRNELVRRGARRWPRQLLQQFTLAEMLDEEMRRRQKTEGVE
jgi:magnesium-transporting ATPase (P-type)